MPSLGLLPSRPAACTRLRVGPFVACVLACVVISCAPLPRTSRLPYALAETTYATSITVTRPFAGGAPADLATAGADVRVLHCEQALVVEIGNGCTIGFVPAERYGWEFVPGGSCWLRIDGAVRTLHVTDGALAYRGVSGIDVQVGGDERGASGAVTHTIVHAAGSRLSEAPADRCEKYDGPG
jgi:hypothetical protein